MNITNESNLVIVVEVVLLVVMQIEPEKQIQTYAVQLFPFKVAYNYTFSSCLCGQSRFWIISLLLFPGNNNKLTIRNNFFLK